MLLVEIVFSFVRLFHWLVQVVDDILLVVVVEEEEEIVVPVLQEVNQVNQDFLEIMGMDIHQVVVQDLSKEKAVEELLNKVATPVKMDMVAQEENHPGYQQDLVIKEDSVVAVALVLEVLVLMVVLAALVEVRVVRETLLVHQVQMVWVEVLEEHLKDTVLVLVDLVVLLLLILSDHSFHRQY